MVERRGLQFIRHTEAFTLFITHRGLLGHLASGSSYQSAKTTSSGSSVSLPTQPLLFVSRHVSVAQEEAHGKISQSRLISDMKVVLRVTQQQAIQSTSYRDC